MEAKSKSVKLNMFLNTVKSLMTVIFPLISFPYVSRILGVESLGKYNFAASIISYILLLAGLGIDAYAIREGSKIRDNKEEFSRFANQIFSINLLSTFIAYAILGVLLCSVPKFESYRTLLIILSTQVLFTSIGVNWIYSIFEEYAYMTIRSAIAQICSIIAMFVFVKTPDDVEIYSLITVFAAVGSNVLNYIFARKYCKIKFTFKMDLKKHVKPILMLFAMAATITIYTSADNIILGFISGEYSVGIYSVSVKIYNIVKSLLASAIIVSIPRIALLYGQKKNKELDSLATSVYSSLLSMVIPGVIGLIAIGKEIILLISDSEYISAYASHTILSITMLFTLCAYFWGTAVLVSVGKENITLKVTIVSAVTNVGLNFILIPFYDEVAAAFTTFVAEFIAFLWCYFSGKKYVNISGTLKLTIKVLIGCIPIIVICIVLRYLRTSLYVYTFVAVALSAISYLIIEILLKNEAITSIINAIIKKIKRRAE